MFLFVCAVNTRNARKYNKANMINIFFLHFCRVRFIFALANTLARTSQRRQAGRREVRERENTTQPTYEKVQAL